MCSRCMEVFYLGLQPYCQALDLQRRLLQEVLQGEKGNMMLLVRHHPVYTVGRSGRADHLPSTRQIKRVPVVEVERGGDITYHGPGQLVAYPLWKLDSQDRDLHRIVRKMEEAAMGLLRRYGLVPLRREGLPGVWLPGLEPAKIASVGMSLKKWVTYHGMAVNIREEGQEPFKFINPCGLPGVQVTSLEKETGLKPPWEEISELFIESFSSAAGLKCFLSPENLNGGKKIE